MCYHLQWVQRYVERSPTHYEAGLSSSDVVGCATVLCSKFLLQLHSVNKPSQLFLCAAAYRITLTGHCSSIRTTLATC